MRIRGLALLLAALSVAGCNDVAGPIRDAVDEDPRNASVVLDAGYAGLFDRDVLVLELEDTDGTAPVDLLRVLLQSAKSVQDREFDRVELHGPTGHVFSLPGSYFGTLGREYDSQNPVYTMRSLPYELEGPDGGSEYFNTGGGLMGLGGQFEDFGDAMSRWAGLR